MATPRGLATHRDMGAWRSTLARVAFWLAVAYALVWMAVWIPTSVLGATLGTDPCSGPRCTDLVTLAYSLIIGLTPVWMGLSVYGWTRPARGWRVAGFLFAFGLPLATWYILAGVLLAPAYHEFGYGSVDWGPWWFPLPIE